MSNVLSDAFCVVVQGSGKRKLLHVPKYDKWDNVFLEYHVDWPLHLLLTPQVSSCFATGKSNFLPFRLC